MKIIALILTYNNRSMIDLAINKIPKELFSEIIVSDDASTDGTSEEYRKRGFKVFSNLKNLGYGGNIKNGIKNILLEHDFDYLVEIHGDGAQFDPSATYDAMTYMNEGYDFIIGSRFINTERTKRGGMSKIRYYSNIILSAIAEFIFKLGISEYHTGFRIYSKSYLKNVPWQKCGDGHIFSFETLALVAYYKLKIAEVKCYCDYNNMHTSISIKNSIWFTFLHFGTMLFYILSKFKIKSKIFY
jgi:glycosyltransferase involved in cell wall biosynthesis